MARRIAVTGMGVLTPIGNTLDAFLDSLRAGRSGAGPITRFDASGFKTNFACEVKDYDPEQYIDKKESRRIDPFSQYALTVAHTAITDSGLDVDNLQKDRVGVVWGSGIGGFST